jgi:hypothetical protein
MSEDQNVGREVWLQVPGGDVVFCVDGTDKVRGSYTDGFRHYMSSEELWTDWDSKQYMKGDVKTGSLVSVIDPLGKPVDWNGYALKDVRVRFVKRVDMAASIAKDPGIAGITRPVYRPDQNYDPTGD